MWGSLSFVPSFILRIFRSCFFSCSVPMTYSEWMMSVHRCFGALILRFGCILILFFVAIRHASYLVSSYLLPLPQTMYGSRNIYWHESVYSDLFEAAFGHTFLPTPHTSVYTHGYTRTYLHVKGGSDGSAISSSQSALQMLAQKKSLKPIFTSCRALDNMLGTFGGYSRTVM